MRSRSEWLRHAARMEASYRSRHLRELQLEQALRDSPDRPVLRGYSYHAGREVDFGVVLGESGCNWRETLLCPVTGLINRARGALHVFDTECAPYDGDRIYLMEQTTATYRFLRQRFPGLVGSEFLGDGIARGSVVDGVRHEDGTRLSFGCESLDHVLHFDVFEHIPDCGAAFAECHRVLRPGGSMLWTVPFVPGNEHTIVRAVIAEDGTCTHLLEPEYHGDPIRAGGTLCFYHFGWEMLDQVRSTGFSDAYAVLFWSEPLGYLGGESVVFVARK